MKLHERLKKARTDLGLTQAAVAALFQEKGHAVKQYSISNWEKGKRKPSIEEFALLCELYKVRDVLFLLTGKPAPVQPDSLLDGLNRQGKEHAVRYIRFLKDDAAFTAEKAVAPARAFRLYDMPISAGTGMFLDSDTYEEITADDIVPAETAYAVRVSGDSMEPKFHHGQILFIKEQSTLDDGEIGIFALNGEAYVKKLVQDSLISLNPRYQPIKIHEWDAFRIFGKVIGAN